MLGFSENSDSVEPALAFARAGNVDRAIKEIQSQRFKEKYKVAAYNEEINALFAFGIPQVSVALLPLIFPSLGSHYEAEYRYVKEYINTALSVGAAKNTRALFVFEPVIVTAQWCPNGIAKGLAAEDPENTRELIIGTYKKTEEESSREKDPGIALIWGHGVVVNQVKKLLPDTPTANLAMLLKCPPCANIGLNHPEFAAVTSLAICNSRDDPARLNTILFSRAFNLGLVNNLTPEARQIAEPAIADPTFAERRQTSLLQQKSERSEITKRVLEGILTKPVQIPEAAVQAAAPATGGKSATQELTALIARLMGRGG